MSLPVEKALRKAQSHIKAGELAEAEELYKQVLSKFPKNKKAIQGYQKLKVGITSKGSSTSDPPQEQVQDLINLYNQVHFEKVLEKVKPLISLFPKAITLHNIQGASNTALQRYDAAIASHRKALIIKPDDTDTHCNIGDALQAKGELDAAIENYQQAINIKPDHARAYYNLGNALHDHGELEAAIKNFKQAVEINSELFQAYFNMGNALKFKGELDAAIDSYKKAIKIKPDYADAHNNLGSAYLNTGRLKEGLDENEWRWKTSSASLKKRQFSQPLWDGITSLKDKTILLWGEQGPGDVVMWSSCLSLVASQAEKCILECEEKLVPLLARSFPKVEVRAENRSVDNHRDDFDVHLPIGSLFRHFIPEISKKTKPNAFLIPDPVRVNFWKERLNLLGNGPFVGISWKSPLVTPARLPNYTRIPDWAPVLALSDVTFVNLQSSEFKDDLAEIWDKFGVNVHNFDDLDHYNDLDDVAALSASFDVVISVSTAVSTIAAGVGTPTKMLHWRQSPWNNILLTPRGPFVDVFERNTWEAWDNVLHSVAKDIADY